MLDAYCEEKEKGFFAYEIWQQLTEDEIRSFHWYCCPLCCRMVTPYVKHQREGYWVVSHFKFKAGEDNICPHKESDLHLATKMLIATLVELPDTQFYDGCGFRFSLADGLKEKPKIEFRWENPERRTDVMLPLKKFHTFLGKGIAFEIQLSHITDEEKSKRIEDWHLNGFSVSWLDRTCFRGGDLASGIANPILITHPYGGNVLKLLDAVIDLRKRVKVLEQQVKTVTSYTNYLKRQRGVKWQTQNV